VDGGALQRLEEAGAQPDGDDVVDPRLLEPADPEADVVADLDLATERPLDLGMRFVLSPSLPSSS
jgi:hypothetical protein